MARTAHPGTLILKSSQGDPVVLAAGKITTLKAQAGTKYRVLRKQAEVEREAREVVAVRRGEDLHLGYEDGTGVVLEGFYGTCKNAACAVELPGAEAAGYTIHGDTAVGATLANGGQLVYAFGETQPLLGILPVPETVSGYSASAGLSTYIPPGSDLLAGSLLGGAVLGGAAIAAGGGAAAQVAAYTLTVTAVAGPFNAADKVEVYDKDGILLFSDKLNPANGQYVITITNGYRGVIFVKVIDDNDTGANYTDEATGAPKSLGTELRAMAMADGSSNVSVTVSPLTELAVRAAGVTGNVVTEANLAANTQIGKLFGVTDITGPVTTVVDAGYNDTDGTSAAEQYGKVLAALSGADAITGSVDATLDQLQATIVQNPSDPTQLAIKQAGVDLVNAGVEQFEAGGNAGEATLNIQNSQKAPWVEGASDGLNATTEAGSGTVVKTEITGATAGTVIRVTWGNQSFNYTITDTDADVSAGIATIPVARSVITAAGDGDIAVTTQVGSNAVSPAVLIVVDTSAPTAGPDLLASSDTGASSTDNITADATPTLSIGSLPAGVTAVELLVNGSVVTSTYDPASGVISPNADLAAGTQAISYRYVRGTFTGAASPELSITLDTAAPAAPAITGITDDVTPTTGTVVDAGTTNDSTPTLVGTAEAHATVKVYSGDTLLGSTTADATGNWSFTPATPLADSSYSLTATATDAAGNVSAASSASTFTLDTVAPSAPATAADLSDASDTGSSNSDNLTRDTTPSFAIGTLPTGVTGVKLLVNGVEVAAAYNATTGELTPDSALSDGVKTITYSYVDAAGNESPTSPALAVTIDTTPASDPTANPSGGRLLTGAAEPGASVTLSWTDGGTPQTATITADANGAWRYPESGLLSPGLPNGTVVTLSATDAAGNPAAQSASVTVDTLPPTLDALTDNVGRITGSVANGGSTDDTTPTLSGTTGTAGGVTGDVLKVYNGTTYLGDASVNGTDGTWTFTPSSPLAEGPLNLSVKWVNSSNTPISNGASGVFSLVVDTTGPSAPVNAPDLIAADDSGRSATDNITRVTRPTLNLGAGLIAGDVAAVVVYDGNTEIPGTYNPATGDFVPDAPLAEGEHSLTYKLADAAGNLSAASPALSITLDTDAPSAPASAPDLTVASDTGRSSSDNETSDNTPSFAVAAPASGESVKLFVDGVEVAASYANGEITPTVALGDGVKSITYKYVDAAGNLSDASPALSVTIDTTAPQRPSFAPNLTVASDTGASDSDNITGDNTPSFAIGELPTGVTGIKLLVDGVEVAATYDSSTGEISPSNVLGEGFKAITYKYVDAAGNESPVSPDLNVTIDTTVPADPSANPSGGRLLTGAAEPGAIVTLTWTPSGGTPQTATVTANANGGWRYPGTGVLTTGIPEGTVVTVSTADPAGNASANTATVTVSIAGPTIDSVTDDVARVLGTVANGGSTNDTQPTLAGTVGTNTGATTGDYLRIFNGSTYLGDAAVDAVNGTWSFTPATALAEGAYDLKAQWVTGGTANTNDGTNASNGTSAVFTLTVDTTAPSAPAAPAAADLVSASDTGSSDSDNNTADNTPSFTVTGPASGETLKLYVDGVEVPATYDANTGTLTPNAPLSDGEHAITYGYVDAAGNIGAQSTPLAVIIDTTAPAAPSSAPDLTAASDTGASSTDNVTADTTPSFAIGQLPTGVTGVKLLVDGVEVTATYDATTGEITPDSPLGDGVKAIRYQYVDAAGNVSAASPSLSVTVDTTAPATPANAPDLTAASDTGSSATDNLTNDTTPSFAIGQLPAGVTGVKLLVDNVEVEATYNATTGEITPNTPLGGGVKVITYKFVDAAGNVSAASPSLSITLDATPPTTDPTAEPSGGKVFSGTAEPGGSVTLSWSETGVPKTATVIADDNGDWIYRPTTQVPNETVVTVAATDKAGNPAPNTASVTVAIQPPSITSVVDDVAGLTGNIAEGGLTNDPTLTLSGSTGTASGSFLRVYDGSTYLGDAVVDLNTETWTFTTPALGDAPHALSVKWVTGGTAGNNDGTATSNGSSAARNLTLDATAPATPANAPDLIAASDTGSSDSDNITADTTPSFAIGQLPAGVTNVKLLVDGVEVAATYDATTGQITPDSALGDGVKAITYKYVDAAGNESGQSPSLSVTIDATAPATPANAPDLIAASDTGSSDTDDTTSDTTPSFTIGALPTGVTSVKLLVDGVEVDATYDATSGEITPTAALGDGVKAITYKYVDAAGNVSAASPSLSVTIDATAPATPANAPDLIAASDTGSSDTDNTTSDTTPSFAIGQLPTGVTSVKLLVDGVEVDATYDATTGEITPTTALGDGVKAITYKYVDAAGNVSAASPSLNVTIDATAPAAPAITSVSDDVAPVTGTVADAGTTNDTTPTFTGTAEANATVTLYNGNTVLGTTTADANGDWTFTPATALTEGAYSITAKATDAAGNESAASAARTFTLDTTAPTLSSSSPADNATSISAGSNIVLTFSEAVSAGTGSIVISNGTDTRTISITDTTQVTISGTTVTINPTTDLQGGAACNVQIASGVIRDTAGNAYAGITTSTALNFNTAVPSIDLGSIASGNGGLVINGDASYGNSGYSVSAVGDLNNDGLNDLIVSAPVGAEKVYVVYGTTRNAPIELSDVALGSGGFVINAHTFAGGVAPSTGLSVAGAGDVNGDGISDLVIGAPSGSPQPGNTYVVFGQTDTTPVELSAVAAGTGGFMVRGATGQSELNGRSVAGAGDVNGDGLADIILASPNRNGGNGTSYVVYGKTSTTAIDVSALDAGSGGFSIAPFKAYSVSGAGDVNGDGFSDLLVASEAAANTGQALVIFGNSTGTAPNLTSLTAGGGGGFLIQGMCMSDYTGSSVANAGDVNGDGLADVIVGAQEADPNNIDLAGRAFIVFGKTSTVAVQLSAVAAGTGGFVINGESGNNMIGFSVSSAGDINGDGLSDLLVASPYAGPATLNKGRTYVVFGGTATAAVNLTAVAAGSGGFAVNGQCNGDQSGFSVSAAGDVNGDGLADLVVGGVYGDPGRPDAGKTYVIFGSTGGAFNQTAVDVVGTTGDDTLSDSGTAKTLVAGTGNDTLTATAASVLYGGAGDDRFEIDAAMITALQSPLGSGDNIGQLARIDGGHGIDTIALAGSGLTLNLRQIANQAAGNPDGGSRIDSVERINLTGTGNNTLTLDPADIRDMAGMNLFNDGNGWTGLGATVQKHQLLVDGNAGDVINASGYWNAAGTVTVNGQTYAVYNDTSSATQLLVDTDITRNIAPPPLALSSVNAGINGFAINGESSNTYSGSSVANAGDVNGDGLDDLIVGTPNLGSSTGRSYVVFGKTSGTAVELSAVSPTATGVGGFAIYGESASDQSGISVSTAGDMNGDGLADLLVGAYNSSAAGTQSGRSYVVYGKTGTGAVHLSAIAATAGSSEGFVINAQGASSWTAHSVAAAGDVNGDGFADLVIGADQRTPSNGLTKAGASYVIFGSATPAAVDLSAVAATSSPAGGFVINGQGASDWSGYSVSGAGDVNGDGLADVIVGAYNSDLAGRTDAGRSYVVYGKTGTAVVELSDVAAGNGGFVINGAVAYDNNGVSVANAGDVNGDGLADLIVGAVYTGAGLGKSYVVFGKTGTSAIELSAVAGGTGGFLLAPEVNGDNSGFSVASAGDMNGDGLADLIVGANWRDRTYIVYGKTDSATVQLSAVAAGNGGVLITGQSENSGTSVSAAGDVNGDGLADVIVGANTANTVAGGSRAGRSYVIFGSTGGNFAGGTTVDVFGTTGNDTLADSGVAKTIVADQGNDTITATAASVVYAGAGDDNVVIDAAMITALQAPLGSGGNVGQLVRVDGGNGIDTLTLAGADLTLNLRQVANQAAANPDGGSRLNSIEKIDLTGAGNNTLTLDPADIRDMAGMNLFNASNGWTALGATVQKHQLLVDGNTGDVLNASGTWTTGGSITVNGQTYAVYNDAASAAQLLVDADITCNLTVAADPAPTLSSSSPADNASGVAASSNIVLTFSEAVVAGTGNIVISNGTDTRTISITDTSQVTISGSTVTINPSTDLLAGTSYNVQMASGVIKDTTGNNYAGISNSTTLNFSTPVPAVSAIQLSAIAAGSNGFVINGTSHLTGSALGDLSGFDIASVGDINGDGLSDLLVGAKLSGTYDGSDVYVVFGKSDSTTPIELSDVAAGNGGFLIHRDEAASFVTSYPALSLSTIGDLNGDGLQDILIGETAYKSGSYGQGRTYVVYGKTGTGTVQLSSVSAGSGGFYLDGNSTTQDQAGAAVSSAGDFNGDGLEDLAVFASRDVGATYVVYGKTSAANVVLSGMASSDGLVITGNPRTDYLGSISSAGDVNGDGFADLLIGNPEFDTTLTNVGRSYVVFGRSGGGTINANALTVAENTEGFVINGRTSSASSGYSVSAAGDVNGDGLADLLVGAYGDATGRAYVVFGKTGTSAIELSAIASTTAPSGGFVINGITVTDATGKMVSSAGDMNGDGLADLIVVSTAANTSKGLTYVVYGQTSTAAINLSAISATGGSSIGFLIAGESSSDFSGSAVSAAGDINGDGFDDLIVGAYQADPHSVGNEGKTYVIFGGQQFMQTVDFIGTTGNDAQSGTSAGETFVAGAGNDTLTGNGGADVMFGGAGNDVFVLNADNISKLASGVSSGQLARIDGGNGLDTLQVTGGTSLDLTAIANVGAGTPTGLSRIESIEKIDLATDTAANSLTLRANDVVDMAGMNTVNAGTSGWTSGTYTLQATERNHQLIIDGNASDTLLLSRTETWTNSGTVVHGANTYNVLISQSSAAQLLVDADVVVRKPLGYTLEEEARDGLIFTETSDGTTVTVLISDTAALAGNVLKLAWGGQTISHTLQAADITAGSVTITVPRTTLRAETAVGTQETVAVGVSLYASDATTLIESTQPAHVAVDMRVPNGVMLSAIATGFGGFVINGQCASDQSGFSVSGAGDVNGDGLGDLIVGAYLSDPAAGADAGRSYVVFGKTDTVAIDLSAIAATAGPAGGFVINGQCGSDNSGISVSSAGDVNGDGLADLIVGANLSDPAAGSSAGRSYVVFGKTDTSAINLSAIAATAGASGGFAINGQCAADYSGTSVSSAGDVNGDGLADLIVGANLSDPATGSTAGRSYVVFGKADTSAINLSAIAATAGAAGGFVINGQCATDYSGFSVSSAGDVNGDGLADLIVGAYLSDPAASSSAGRSYVVFGKTDTSAINLSTIAATTGAVGGFVINGQCASDQSGYSVSSAGDVNGDGLADLIVGANLSDPAAGSSAGRSYVVFGKTDTSAINLSAIATTTGAAGGFVINGQCASDESGYSVSSAGDVNGDGLGDLIVGAYVSDPATGTNAGRSYVVYGKSDASAIDLSAIAAGSTAGFVINGQCASDQSGYSVSSAGDVNGDGLADLIVGANLSDPAAGTSAGRSYVIFGGEQFATTVDHFGDASDNTLIGTTSSETFVGGAGNDTLTGGGGADVIYGGAGNDVLGLNADNISHLSAAITDGKLARVDGGTGIDTLALAGSGITLNLRQIANQAAGNPDGGSRIESIERIDLTGSGNNTLTLDPADIRDMAGMNVFNAGNGWTSLGATVKRHQLVVDGNAGDVLNASGSWFDSGTISVGGQTYAVYNDQDSATQLLVDTDITRNLNAVADVAPTLLSSSPADNASSVSASANIVLTFSESVAAGTGNIVISNGTDTRTISVTDTSQVTISGNTVTINPTADLNSGSVYSVQMASGVIQDTTGNNYAGISDATTLNFSTRIASVELSTIAGGTNGFKIDGNQANMASGRAVSGLGDVNGDGLDDLLIGANGYDMSTTDWGAVFVVFGKTSTTAVTLDQSMTGKGFMMYGESQYEQVGKSISSAGDMNGDGLADLLIGNPNSSPTAGFGTYQGHTYVVYGKTDNTVVSLSSDVRGGTKGFAIHGQSGGVSAGSSVASAGDINGDGIDDVIITTPLGYPQNYPSDYLSNSGQAFVVFGKTGTGNVFLSAAVAGSGGFLINGGATAEYLGSAASGAGDVNGDGLADLIISAESADPLSGSNAGKTYVIFGKTDTSTLHLSALAASAGFVINGACASDRSGVAVTSAGDLNGDGLADLAVGMPYSSSFSQGGTYVIFGKTGGSSVELSSINGSSSNGFLIVGETGIFGAQAGMSVSAAGDINGDGLMDLLVGDDLASVTLTRPAGKTYVVFGRTDYSTIQLSEIAAGNGGFVINGETTGYSGRAVSAAGDVNGDGFADLLIGAEGGSAGGRSYVVFGGSYFAPGLEQLGDATANTLTGTSASESFVAGAGNDTLTGNGGADVMYAGAGNDVFVLNADNITKLSAGITDGKLARVDGGTGLDTLRVMGGASLDLTAIANVGGGTPDGFSRIESIEKIDLFSDTAANTLTLRANDVIDMSGMNLFNVDGAATADRFHQLMIKGDAGDTVNIGSGWTATGITYTDATDSNHTYKVYQDTVSQTQLLIDEAIVTANHVI